LFGGLIGATLVAGGTGAVNFSAVQRHPDAPGRRFASVHWGVAGRMVLVWTVTLPAAAVVGAVASSVAVTGGVGVWAVALGGAILGGGIYAASRRDPVTAINVNDLPVPPLVRTAV
jgi:PiT family inorganic phosphate transporter